MNTIAYWPHRIVQRFVFAIVNEGPAVLELYYYFFRILSKWSSRNALVLVSELELGENHPRSAEPMCAFKI